jgi:hypothetical protein
MVAVVKMSFSFSFCWFAHGVFLLGGYRNHSLMVYKMIELQRYESLSDIEHY